MTAKDYAGDNWFALMVCDPLGIAGVGIGAADALSKISYSAPRIEYVTDAMLIGAGLGFLACGAIIHKGWLEGRKESEYSSNPI